MSGEKKTKYIGVDFEQYLYVDPSSPRGLRWKVNRYRGKYHNITPVSAVY